MSDEEISSMIETNFVCKCEMFGINVYKFYNTEECLITFKLVDTITSQESIVIIYREEFENKDLIQKAMTLYNKGIKVMKLLLNARYGKKEEN